jgi:hypothetical protein
VFRPSTGCNSSGGGGGLTPGGIEALPAASSLALADLFPVDQGPGTLAKATVQQALDATGLLANDASPADADKVMVNQGGVAKTLAVSALRTQLDAYASSRTVQASQIALSAGSALQLPLIVQLGGTASSFPALKRSSQDVVFRLADDSGDGNIQVGQLRAPSGGTPKVALFRGTGTKNLGVALANDQGIAWTNGASSESGFDVELDRSTANVLALTNGSSGGAAFQLKQMTAPAGAAATARLYTQDNGAGKTQLMVIFPTGAAIQLAIEA